MRRIFALSVAVLLCVAVLPAAAQDKPPTLARSYSLQVKAGHGAEFEAAMKQQVDWYKKNNETWHWHTWQWETGKHFGDFVFRTPGHHWKDMDDRAERSARARANFQQVVQPHLESMEASIADFLPDVSHWPSDPAMVSMVTVLEFNLHFGMAEEFLGTIGKIHKAIQQTKWPVHYAWSIGVSGTEMPTFWLVIPHKNWTEMKGPEKPFRPMLEEALGRADADAVMQSMMKCVRQQHSALARFRPDLSYIPAK